MARRHRRSDRTRTLRTLLWSSLAAAAAANVLLAVVGGPQPALGPLAVGIGAGSAAGLCVPQGQLSARRLYAWWAIAAGLALVALGDLIRGIGSLAGVSPPGPGLAMTLAAVAGIIGASLLAADRMGGSLTVMRLDTAIIGLAAAAFAAALILGPVLAQSDPVTTTLGPAEALRHLLAPVVSLLLLAVVAGGIGVLGLSGGRDYGLFALGVTVTLVAAWIALRADATASGGALGLLATGGIVLIAAATAYRSQRVDPVVPVEGWNAMALPGAFTVASLMLLGAALAQGAPVTTGALALFSVAAGVGRAALALQTLRTLTATQDKAQIDEVTGLSNRRAFTQALNQAVRDAGEEGELAVFVLDLDRFKVVNEALGAAAGNEILRQTAARLSNLLEPSVPLGRLGGDEFGVVLTGSGREDAALEAAALFTETFAAPFRVGETSIRVDARVGIALRPFHADSGTGLLRRADVAAQQAKNSDDHIAVYESSLDGRHGDRLVTVDQLRAAVTRGELLVYYQPQVDLSSGDITGVEALVRWQHPERGVLRPDSFLALVEQAGLMRELTEVVLGVATRACRRLWDAGRSLEVTVNLAAANLLDAGLTDQVTRLLGREGLPSSALRLEVTERVLMADPARANAIFERLRAVGIAVTLDDFGGGSTSLGYLRRIPTDTLKLDRTLLHGLATDPQSAAVVRCLVDLAHALDLTLAASGVEDAETLAVLRDLGCDTAQGFHIAPPMPIEDLIRWMDRYAGPAGFGAQPVRGWGEELRSAGMLSRMRIEASRVKARRDADSIHLT